MALLYTLAAVTLVLAGLLVYAMRRERDDDDFSPSHQHAYDDDGRPIGR